jgi:hypothetical protein
LWRYSSICCGLRCGSSGSRGLSQPGCGHQSSAKGGDKNKDAIHAVFNTPSRDRYKTYQLLDGANINSFRFSG